MKNYGGGRKDRVFQWVDVDELSAAGVDHWCREWKSQKSPEIFVIIDQKIKTKKKKPLSFLKILGEQKELLKLNKFQNNKKKNRGSSKIWKRN